MGIEGCTQMHELEKHRRDARVLNIYEGTNEVQRFLILRDLVDHVLPQCANWEGEPPVDPLGAEKFALARALKRAVDTFGAQVWQNASFQPTMFKLVDVAGYIKTMDSTLWRTQWLKQNCADSDAPHRSFSERACGGYLDHAKSEMEHLLAEFDRDFTLLKQGLYPPEVRVAFLALQAVDNRQEPARRQIG